MLYIQCIAISISPPTIQGAFKRQPLKLLIWIMFFHFPLWSNLKCLRFYKFSACDRRGKLNFHFHSFQRHWVASHRLCPHCPSSDLYGMAWHGMVWYGMAWYGLLRMAFDRFWAAALLRTRNPVVTASHSLSAAAAWQFRDIFQGSSTFTYFFRFSIVSSLNSIAVWQFWQRRGGINSGKILSFCKTRTWMAVKGVKVAF